MIGVLDTLGTGTSVDKLKRLRALVLDDPITAGIVRAMKFAPRVGPIARAMLDGLDELTPDEGDELLVRVSDVVLSLRSDDGGRCRVVHLCACGRAATWSYNHALKRQREPGDPIADVTLYCGVHGPNTPPPTNEGNTDATRDDRAE